MAVDVRPARHRLGDHLLGHELRGLLEVRGRGEDLGSSPGSPSFGQSRWAVARAAASSGPQQTFVPALDRPCRRRRSRGSASTVRVGLTVQKPSPIRPASSPAFGPNPET